MRIGLTKNFKLHFSITKFVVLLLALSHWNAPRWLQIITVCAYVIYCMIISVSDYTYNVYKKASANQNYKMN